MSHARYDAYKHSGVEWLGEVPAHWREARIKDMAFLERGKFTHRPRNDPQMYDGIHPFIQTGDVARATKYITKYKQTLSDKGIEVSKKFKKGTLLMAIAANIGDVAIVNFDTYFPDSIVGFKPNRSHIDFLFYLFSATRSELDRIKVTSTQDNLNLERLNSLVKFLPPRTEQTVVAAYLDKKTAQLDRKIDLLSQKAAQYGKLKQSLINETVTRGLDKTVAMKDSGVEWIGDVPAHWEVKRVKEVFVESKSKSTTGDETLLSVSEYTGVTQKKGNGGEDDFLSNAESLVGYKICKVGDLVINIMLAWKRGLGVSSFCGIVSPSYAVYSPLKKVNSLFFHYLLRTEDAIAEFKRNSTGIIESRLRLYTDSFYALSVAVPPFDEQAAIAAYLDSKTAHIDRIVATINTQIDKLRELRKTLINDIVTGKIKVT